MIVKITTGQSMQGYNKMWILAVNKGGTWRDTVEGVKSILVGQELTNAQCTMAISSTRISDIISYVSPISASSTLEGGISEFIAFCI